MVVVAISGSISVVSITISVAVSGLFMEHFVRIEPAGVAMVFPHIRTARPRAPRMVSPIIAAIPVPSVVIFAGAA